MAKRNKSVIYNDLSRSNAMKRRHDFLGSKCKELRWSLDEISGGMSSELVSRLRGDLSKLTDLNALKLTSVEQLETWGRTKTVGKPFVGTPIMSNLPVVCIGSSVTDRNRSILADRGLPEEYPAHTGFGAHRMTWGTLYIKVNKGTKSDGSRFIEDYSLFVGCNQCLDMYLGKLGEQGRTTSAWPKEWVQVPRQNQQQNKKKSAGKGVRKDTRPKLSATKLAIGKVNGKGKDPFKNLTLTMLKAVAKEQGTSFTGNKGSQIAQFKRWILETGDDELTGYLDQRLALK